MLIWHCLLIKKIKKESPNKFDKEKMLNEKKAVKKMIKKREKKSSINKTRIVEKTWVVKATKKWWCTAFDFVVKICSGK